MRPGDTSVGLGFEEHLGFIGGSRIEVVLGLGICPSRFQGPNPQQGSGLPEGLS